MAHLSTTPQTSEKPQSIPQVTTHLNSDVQPAKYAVAIDQEPETTSVYCLVYRNGLLLTQAHGSTKALAWREARRNVRMVRASLVCCSGLG